MVWINKFIFILIIFFYQTSFSNELNKNEEIYFDFIDFNNDDQISFEELEQSLRIIFQLSDFNQDGLISKIEMNEIKKIIESLK